MSIFIYKIFRTRGVDLNKKQRKKLLALAVMSLLGTHKLPVSVEAAKGTKDDYTVDLAYGKKVHVSSNINGRTYWTSESSDNQWIYVDLGEAYDIRRVLLNWENEYGEDYEIQVSNDAWSWKTVSDVKGATGGYDDITFPTERARYVRLYGKKRATKKGFSLKNLEVYSQINIAAGKATYTNSQEKKWFSSDNAVSYNRKKRWSSSYEDDAHIYVDLGDEFTIDRVILKWEKAYGKRYKIRVSKDTKTWMDVYEVENGSGGEEVIEFDPVKARYVMVEGLERATRYGYSLWDFQVYSTDSFAVQSKTPSPMDIIPRPRKFKELQGRFMLKDDIIIYYPKGEPYKIADYLSQKIHEKSGIRVRTKEWNNKESYAGGSIQLIIDEEASELGDEGYKLRVHEDKVIIEANNTKGIFRGVTTLAQLLPDEDRKSVACMEIEDKPDYPWRGFMIDVARRFRSLEDIKRDIDIMAMYKLNKLHLHLTDDQGWRIQIDSWPRLTGIGGAIECGGGTGGYYTKEDYKEIIRYADERYIDVIPEIDMPGHINAALTAYGELNEDGIPQKPYKGKGVGFSSLSAGKEITYKFIDDVIGEIAQMTPYDFIHIGGDEANKTSKEDYDYFMSRATKIVNKHGKTVIGWNDSERIKELSPGQVLQHWKGDITEARENLMPMIVSHRRKAYLDSAYHIFDSRGHQGTKWLGVNISNETAYNWDPTDYAHRQQIMGIEAPIWTEYVDNNEEYDYLVFPRLLCIAEIGWTPKGYREWDDFKNRLSSHTKIIKKKESDD